MEYDQAIVAKVASAIEGCPHVWLRATPDGYYPWELCRYGSGDEPEIVILEQHGTYDAAMEASGRLIRNIQAMAALDAMR